MLSSVLLVTLVVALLSLTGLGIVSSSVRFLLNNPPLFAFTVLVVCVLAPSNDGHACEQLDEFGRLLPCYPLARSKYVGHMCRAAERRRTLRRLWRQVEYVLLKFLNPVSAGIREIWPWVSGLYKYLRDGTPIFLSTVLLILRTAYASAEGRRAALAISFACLVDHLVRYVLVPEVAVLLVSAGAGWTFREPLWEYLKSTGPVLSYLDCYNKELAAEPKRNARKGCLSLAKHQKHESPATRRYQPTNPINERTTPSNKSHASPVRHPNSTSTTGAHESERRTFASSPSPIRLMTDEKRKKSKRTPKAKVTGPVVAATETHDKVIDQKPKDELVGKSATLVAILNSDPPYEKNAIKAPVPSEPTSKAAPAEELQSRAPTIKITVDPPRAESATPSHVPSISTNPPSPPIIIDDRRSEVPESHSKVVDQNKDQEESGKYLPVPSIAVEIKASEPEALDNDEAEDDMKRGNENIVLGERGASTAEKTIAPVPQINLVEVSATPIPAVAPIPPMPGDSFQAVPTPYKMTATEQHVHISDENRPQSLSFGFIIGEATQVPAPVEDVPTTTNTPAETGHSTSAPTNSSRPGATVTTTPGGTSPKRITSKIKKIINSPSRSTPARMLRIYAPIPRFQVKVTAFMARLKERALKKAKFRRQSKHLTAAAAPPSTTSIGPCVATLTQPPPTTAPETMPAPMPAESDPAGNTAMEVCQQPAATPSETVVTGSPMNASLDPIDEPMLAAESGPVVESSAVECPLPPIVLPALLASITVVPQVVVSPKQLVIPPAIAPRVPLSIPCKLVDAASFFKPYKSVQLPRPAASPVPVGSPGASTPQAVYTTSLPMPTTGGLSHLKQYTPVPVPRLIASSSSVGPPQINLAACQLHGTKGSGEVALAAPQSSRALVLTAWQRKEAISLVLARSQARNDMAVHALANMGLSYLFRRSMYSIACPTTTTRAHVSLITQLSACLAIRPEGYTQAPAQARLLIGYGQEKESPVVNDNKPKVEIEVEQRAPVVRKVQREPKFVAYVPRALRNAPAGSRNAAREVAIDLLVVKRDRYTEEEQDAQRGNPETRLGSLDPDTIDVASERAGAAVDGEMEGAPKRKRVHRGKRGKGSRSAHDPNPGL